MALPWLEAMGVNAASVTNAGSITPAEIPRRVYFSNWGFFEARAATPKDTGLNYTLTPTLTSLAPHKSACTVFTGMRTFHGGHEAQPCLLTGMNTPHNGVKLVSVDQQIAEFYQGITRVPSLVLSIERSPLLSWTRNKTPITPMSSPKAVFDRLFAPEDAATKAAIRNRMHAEQSILDRVMGQAQRLEKKLGKDDRLTLDQYFTSIRELEERIKIDSDWLDRPKKEVKAQPDFGPTPAVIPPYSNAMEDPGLTSYLKLMFDVIVLAFQTDSTRVVSHFPKGEDGPVFASRTKSPVNYHELTHHGNQVDKFKWWAAVDECYIEFWAYFLDKLKSVEEGNGTLLDHTMAAWATTNGEGGHGNRDLPVILCGGSALGIKHQGHLVKKDVMVGDVWQTMVSRIAKAGPAGLENMPIPKDFQGGQAKGVIKEVL